MPRLAAAGSRTDSSAASDAVDAARGAGDGAWRYLVWRFIGVCAAALVWLALSWAFDTDGNSGARSCVCRGISWRRWWKSALGGLMMAGSDALSGPAKFAAHPAPTLGSTLNA